MDINFLLRGQGARLARRSTSISTAPSRSSPPGARNTAPRSRTRGFDGLMAAVKAPDRQGHEGILTVTAVLLALAGAGCALRLARRLDGWRSTSAGRRPRPAPQGPRPGVSLLKPLHGDEPELYRNLRSACLQDYARAGRGDLRRGRARATAPCRSVARLRRPSSPTSTSASSSTGAVTAPTARCRTSPTWWSARAIPWWSSPTATCWSGPTTLDRVVGGAGRPRASAPSPASTAASRCRAIWSRLAVQLDRPPLPAQRRGRHGARPGQALLRIDHRAHPRHAGPHRRLSRPSRTVSPTITRWARPMRALGLTVAVPRDLVLGHTCTAGELRRP